MNIPVALQQFNKADHELDVFMGCTILKMPTSNVRFPNCYGKVRLSVMLRSLPCVVAFVASDGSSFDPETVSDEDLEAVINHLKQHCRPNSSAQTIQDAKRQEKES